MMCAGEDASRSGRVPGLDAEIAKQRPMEDVLENQERLLSITLDRLLEARVRLDGSAEPVSTANPKAPGRSSYMERMGRITMLIERINGVSIGIANVV